MNLRRNEIFINEDDEFEGRIRFNLERLNKRIADFDIDFSDDIDLSDVMGDSDFVMGKSFMHSSSGILENIDLYVPRNPDDIAVIVCSNASSYNEIYYGCSNESLVTNEEVLYLPNPRIEISSDGLYFIVHGITGTGAMGANVSVLGSSSANATFPGNDSNAFAGNVTELILPESSGTTQTWQDYFGNVTGTIILADNSDNIMYNWSAASPEGTIMASINNSIVWNNLQCFNFTAAGNYTSEGDSGGQTNLFGTNLTQLEGWYNIKPTDIDGVDETFTLLGLGTHDLFYINHNEFEEGECYNSRVGNFEEVLMYEPTTASIVYTALLKDDTVGFNKDPYDFEMLVLEDGHGGQMLLQQLIISMQLYINLLMNIK